MKLEFCLEALTTFPLKNYIPASMKNIQYLT